MEDTKVILDSIDSSMSAAGQAMLCMIESVSTTAVAMAVVVGDGERDENEEELDIVDMEGPGKGRAINGVKAIYMRRQAQSRITFLKSLNSASSFSRKVHMPEQEFEWLYDIVRDELEKPMNVRQELTEAENAARKPRARRIPNKEILFFFLEALGGAVEGSIGVEAMGQTYGFSDGTASNYFRHALFSVFTALKAQSPALISWPTAQERHDVHGLIPDFPKVVFFVDGNCGRCFRLGNPDLQEQKYNGYKKIHCYSTMVMTDIFGRYIWVETVDVGSESDKTMFIDCDVGKHPSHFLSEGERGMADMGYAGINLLEVPDKRNQNIYFPLRKKRNSGIRGSRMVNEWAMGYVNNRYRMFLGRWSFSPELYSIAFETVCMMANWRFDLRGYALKRRELYERRRDGMEDGGESIWSDDSSESE